MSDPYNDNMMERTPSSWKVQKIIISSRMVKYKSLQTFEKIKCNYYRLLVCHLYNGMIFFLALYMVSIRC